MQSAPTLALLCCILLAPSVAALGVPPRGVVHVIGVCEPFGGACLSCDFWNVLSPCRVTSPGFGCVPNTVEPRAMRPSTTVENCIPPTPERDEMPEPLWNAPVWFEEEDLHPTLERADVVWEEQVDRRVGNLLP